MTALLLRRTTRRVGSLTARQAVAVLRREHTPYVPQIVSVLEDGIDAEWREPTFEEQVESETWCDGCNRAADRCSVATVLALVDSRPWWRWLLPARAAGPSSPTASTPDGA